MDISLEIFVSKDEQEVNNSVPMPVPAFEVLKLNQHRSVSAAIPPPNDAVR